MNERPIAFYPQLCRSLDGDIEAAIFYQQIWFWSDKGFGEDGFIYKTIPEIEQETTLSEKSQRRVIKRLVDANWLIQENRQGTDGRVRRYFKPLMSVQVVIGQQISDVVHPPKRSGYPPKRENPSISENTTEKVQDSPSENNLSFEEQEIRIVPDGEEKEPRAKADPKVRQIAEAYMKHKKFVYKTAGHRLRDLARNMKTAKKLVEFTGPEIYKCIEFCEEKFGDMWTLETVEKQMSNAHKS